MSNIIEELECHVVGCHNEFTHSHKTSGGVVAVCDEHKIDGDKSFDPRCDNCGCKKYYLYQCSGCLRGFCDSCECETCAIDNGGENV